MFDFYVIVNGKLVGFDSEKIAKIYYDHVRMLSDTTVQLVQVKHQKFGESV
jgi:hypothetical protein